MYHVMTTLVISCYFISRQFFQKIILVMSVISTGLCCVLPEVNAFILMAFGGPIVMLLVDEYKRFANIAIEVLASKSVMFLVLEIVNLKLRGILIIITSYSIIGAASGYNLSSFSST